jgi:hypothetical protein
MATPLLEAVEAERKIVSDIRAVLRKLAASRVLSVATKPANLARLTDKAFRQEFPAEKPDNRLASAIARGIPARRKLAEDEGGSLSAAQAAQAGKRPAFSAASNSASGRSRLVDRYRPANSTARSGNAHGAFHSINRAYSMHKKLRIAD